MKPKSLKLTLVAILFFGAGWLWLYSSIRRPDIVTVHSPVNPLASVSFVEKPIGPAEASARPTTLAANAGGANQVVGEGEEDSAADAAVYGSPSNSLLARRQGDRWVVQGDVLVDESRLASGIGDDDARIAKIDSVQYWDGGLIPYEIDPAMDSTNVLAAIAELEKKTSVRFVRLSNEADFVYFTAPMSGEEICQSYLGKKGGRQEVVLHPTCTKGQILHEMMHVLGFVHEHSREDRDQWVEILWDNIQPNQKNQFQKITRTISIPIDLPFDFRSILLYPVVAFSQNGKFTITKKDGLAYFANREALSVLDIQRINLLYGGHVSRE